MIQAAGVAAREVAAERPSRELSLAITKLDEAHMWTAASMTVNAGELPPADELLARVALG